MTSIAICWSCFDTLLAKIVPQVNLLLRLIKQYCSLQTIDPYEFVFLAHRIRISEILLWDKQSYQTHSILHRLSWRASYIGCIGTRAHCRQVTSLLCFSGVIIRNCILAYSGTSGSLFLNKKTVVSKKKNPLFM